MGIVQDDAPFRRRYEPSHPDADAQGYVLLPNVDAPMEYFVESEGVRSGVFTLQVVEMPYVQRLELEYRFPAYTGLQPQKIEDGGDIAVLRGTEVRVRAIPTMTTAGGQLVIEKGEAHGLTPDAEGALIGSFKVDRDGLYHLEMDAPTGERVTASPEYTIDALSDGAPTVSIATPGRDTQVSPIEEVFVEARADDDYGVRNLELVYSVNGDPEKSVRLFSGQKRMPEVSAGHTFYLEELGLKAGDFVSYYARATDNDTVGGAKPASSDIYFMRVRPLSKDFRQAQSQASGGGGGGGGGEADGPNNLSEQQKQIISATFNIQRDRKSMTADQVKVNTTVVALSQTKLREQVEQLVLQMNQRLGGDESFAKIIERLHAKRREDRYATAAELASGYLYYVSLKGVTGAANLDVASVTAKLTHPNTITLYDYGRTIHDLATRRGLIVIGEASVSRQHAQIVRVGDQFAIEDMKSSNGTFVNNRAIDRHELASGDQVQIGRTAMLFTGGDGAERAQLEASLRAPSASTRSSAASMSSTQTSRCACCGCSGSGHAGALWSGAYWKAIRGHPSPTTTHCRSASTR